MGMCLTRRNAVGGKCRWLALIHGALKAPDAAHRECSAIIVGRTSTFSLLHGSTWSPSIRHLYFHTVRFIFRPLWNHEKDVRSVFMNFGLYYQQRNVSIFNKLFPSYDYDYELISKFRERLKNRLEIIKCDKYICSKWRQGFTDNVLYTTPWNFEVSAF